jgi:hypothetical protein
VTSAGTLAATASTTSKAPVTPTQAPMLLSASLTMVRMVGSSVTIARRVNRSEIWLRCLWCCGSSSEIMEVSSGNQVER